MTRRAALRQPEVAIVGALAALSAWALGEAEGLEHLDVTMVTVDGDRLGGFGRVRGCGGVQRKRRGSDPGIGRDRASRPKGGRSRLARGGWRRPSMTHEWNRASFGGRRRGSLAAAAVAALFLSACGGAGGRGPSSLSSRSGAGDGTASGDGRRAGGAGGGNPVADGLSTGDAGAWTASRAAAGG